ncbi:hypothetical protein ABFG93_22245 (plasmid) [Pseudalkalibacillus hwajinpoensis]|uniref:hypothetical protein n=1 Tax=Guptibacillus hwajinpoensis TaxID=208199 RepID=UPI00325BEFED
MGFKDDMRKWKEETKADFKKVGDEFRATRAEQKEKYANEPKMSEQEKLAKTGNMMLKGYALWYILPFLAFMLILGVMVAFWL